MLSNTTDNLNELEESDFRYDFALTHLSLTLWNLSKCLMRQNTTKKCEYKEGSLHASLEVTGSAPATLHLGKYTQVLAV
jgi:hypothetical protein